jgi:hypothetical protein
MSPLEILALAESRGVRIELDTDGNLDLTYRDGALTDEIRALLRERKPAIVAELAGRLPNPKWLLLFSATVQELVVVTFAPDAKVPERLAQYTQYTCEEAAALEGADDAVLRAAHSVKRVFGGTIVPGEARP